jgi:hypothetical protein
VVRQLNRALRVSPCKHEQRIESIPRITAGGDEQPHQGLVRRVVREGFQPDRQGLLEQRTRRLGE